MTKYIRKDAHGNTKKSGDLNLDKYIRRFTGSTTETDPIVGAVTGIVKADGAGTIAAAVAGVDYLTPTGSGAALTDVVHTETDPIVGAINGIVKANGAGVISAAVAGVDYLTPDGDGSQLTHLLEFIPIACGGFETDIEVDTGVGFYRLPNDKSFTLVGLPRAVMKVAPVGSTAQFDINDDGGTIFSTVISIDASEFSSDDATTPCALTSTPYTFAAGSAITIDIDQIGSGTAGQEPIVTLWGYWTEIAATTTTTTTTP